MLLIFSPQNLFLTTTTLQDDILWTSSYANHCFATPTYGLFIIIFPILLNANVKGGEYVLFIFAFCHDTWYMVSAEQMKRIQGEISHIVCSSWPAANAQVGVGVNRGFHCKAGNGAAPIMVRKDAKLVS